MPVEMIIGLPVPATYLISGRSIASNEGIRLLLCDSTNAEEHGHAPSETSISGVLWSLFHEHRDRRIITASFASHIHRIQQIIDAAWEDRANLSPKSAPAPVIDAVEKVIAQLDSGALRVDLADDESVSALFAQTGPVDAVISTTGNVHFGPLQTMTAAQFNSGLQDKLLGQVRLALAAQHHLTPGGSITLTTGIISAQPIRDGVNATAVNQALEGFVRAAALELLPRGLRINVVSPNVLIESMAAYGPYFPGFEAVSAQRAALAFQRAVEGIQSGETITVW